MVIDWACACWDSRSFRFAGGGAHTKQRTVTLHTSFPSSGISRPVCPCALLVSSDGTPGICLASFGSLSSWIFSCAWNNSYHGPCILHFGAKFWSQFPKHRDLVVSNIPQYILLLNFNLWSLWLRITCKRIIVYCLGVGWAHSFQAGVCCLFASVRRCFEYELFKAFKQQEYVVTCLRVSGMELISNQSSVHIYSRHGCKSVEGPHSDSVW